MAISIICDNCKVEISEGENVYCENCVDDMKNEIEGLEKKIEELQERR